ncbi:MAG: valine--tRNA ligase [Myxococcales bacterium]
MTARAATDLDPVLDKPYEAGPVETRWAREWEERGFFRATDRSENPPFSIVLPPPNVTGSLHIGHALTATLEDALVRYKRMSGFNALWLPGIDHAGIATQMMVERELQKSEKKSRHDLGREEFVRRVWKWKEQYGSRIGVQHRALGASLDWNRERFTMDEQSSRAVREAFNRLYEEKLLYRAERLINWCPKDGTALSDLEVDHQESKGELYKFAYRLADDSAEIVVATTRPETMLGDTAVAVHPDDERYKALVGKKIRHPIVDREFPIVADAQLVDPKFGTGAVKVTPAHSFEDFEAAKRNGLPFVNILNADGTLNENAGPFQGQDRIKVRAALKARIAELGLERGTEPHAYSIGHCQRCGTVVEPILSKQWFVSMKPLAEPVVHAVEADRIRFVPEVWRAEFFRWLNNIHDWCVSRQLWWGHQIPAWYCENDHVTVARETARKCSTCGSTTLRQDPDVLDTWFSSGLWPFSTLGWPERTSALETFYPNSVMETGFDILFFWVARMAMLGLHLVGEVPFRTVFLHAMVRDEKGEKMSKTRGNVIDPLDVTAKYGADALRMTLASMAGQGRDIKLSTERIAGYRSFANKIWNAARFVLMNAQGYDPAHPAPPASVYDRWILSRLSRCADETRTAMDEFRLSDAANGIYKFVWGELCDWAIELAKPALYDQLGAAEKAGAQATLVTALEGALRLLHPFMPFVTEEVWQRLPKAEGQKPSVMISPFPKATDYAVDPVAEREMDLVARAIEGARSVRGEVNLPPNQPVPIVLLPRDGEVQRTFRDHEHAFKKLANASQVTVLAAGAARPRKAAVHVEAEVEVHLPLEGLIDFAAEKVRVEKEIGKIETDLLGLEKRLGNPGFVARAPPEVVEKDRARASELQGKRDKLARHLSRVASPEEHMDEQHNGRNHDGEDDEKEQGHRGADQMGTHGGPAGGQPAAGAEGAAEGEEEEGEEGEGEEEEQHEKSGHVGYSSQAEADKEGGATEASREDEEEGLAAQAVTRVKSIARGLMSKKDDDDEESGPKTETEKLDEMAKAAPKVQRRAAKRKASKVTRGKTGKADVGRKSVRGGKNKAAKAGKVGARAKLGREAAKKGAKKGTRGGTKKQQGRPVGKGDRRSAVRGPESRGQGRTSEKGGRGKTGAKQRPSPRRSAR